MQDEFVPIEARYMKYFDRVLTRNTPDRRTKTYCIFIYGPPGTGKSFTSRKEAAQSYGCPAPYALALRDDVKSMQWWDNYSGQTAVTIDEFVPGSFSVPVFNALMDEGPYQVQVKGNYEKFVSKVVFITSNHTLAECFPAVGNPEGVNPSVLRRVDEYWTVSYHPDHPLDPSKPHDPLVPSHAIWHCAKGATCVCPDCYAMFA
jgi:RNA helicase